MSDDITLANAVTEFASFLLNSIEELPDPHRPLYIPDGVVLDTLVAFSDASSPNQDEPVAALVLRVQGDGTLEELRYLTGSPALIAQFLKDWAEEGEADEERFEGQLGNL
jgi:hypothetical protein